MTEAPTRDPELPDEPASRARERTCVGCGEHAHPSDLVRLVLGPSGEIVVDAAGGGFGRGAHVHSRASCLESAASRGLLRVTKGQARSVSIAVKRGAEVETAGPVPLSAAALADAIRLSMDRRVEGLLATAVRTRKAQVGSDAVTGAWRAGQAALIVVAKDAAAADDLAAVRDAISKGCAVAWGDKQTLAAALLRRPTAEGVAVVAVTDGGVATAVRVAVEKSIGAITGGAASASPRRSRAPSGRSARDAESFDGEPSAGSKRGVKVTAPRSGFRGKVEPERAGRASGRHLRRAQESRQ